MEEWAQLEVWNGRAREGTNVAPEVLNSNEVEVCAICGVTTAYGKGEHIWPAWFLKDADRAGPPKYGWAANGSLLTNRSGGPLEFEQRQRQLIPACRDCNRILDARFEHSAKPIVRRLVNSGWDGEATEDEWRIVGAWFAKILLLTTHPRAHYEHPAVVAQMAQFFGEWDVEHFAWLIDGSAPPADLSLWLFRAHTEPADPLHRMAVPSSVKEESGAVTAFPLTQITHAGLCLTLFWHPGWSIEHPLVRDGAAWEILHCAKSGNLFRLPLLPHRAIAWRRLDVELLPNKHLDGSLPPLHADFSGPVPPEIMDVAKHLSPWVAPHHRDVSR